MNRRRYGDDDRHFGPFTLSRPGRSSWRPLGVMLNSDGDSDDHSGKHGCHLLLQACGYTLIVELPPILLPYREKHVATTWDAATVARLGRDWYFETFSREIGFRVADDAVHVHYGAQTHSSETTKVKVIWIPWKQWRHVRHSLYGLNGEHYWTEPKERRGIDGIRDVIAARDACPSASFAFKDYDGQQITASTVIEEREWRWGERWWRWLSMFSKPRVRRSLHIQFSSEVGPEKGSWKGGTLGHGIEMLPGELHEAAFRRYCAQQHRSKHRQFGLTFIGKAAR